MKILDQAEITGKRILVRFDFDVPVNDQGEILDPNRIEAALPTLRVVLAKKPAQILILAHRGQPQGPDESLSLKTVGDYLAKKLSANPSFGARLSQPNFVRTNAVFHLYENVFLLENVRFLAGETENDHQLAAEYAAHGDLFIFDAFATAHRAHASTVGVSQYLPVYAGLRVALEVQHLGSVKDNPEKPYVMIIGGAKIEDKLPVIANLASKCDQFLIGGAVANTFLKAKGEEVKKSRVDDAFLDQAKQILGQFGPKITLPLDHQWQDDAILDIGPKTIQAFEDVLADAGSVFWNGCLGKTEELKFSQGSLAIGDILARTKDAVRVVAGGDTVGLLNEHHLAEKMTFVSTGGGAALEYLAGKELPALKVLG